MQLNFLMIFLASVIPMVIGFVWYNPKTFGNAWMKETGMTPEKAQNSNMAKVFGLTWLLSFLFAFMLQNLVIHQFHIWGMLTQQPESSDPNSEPMLMLKRFMELYGTSYRTFKHGAFHGILSALFLIWPVIGVNALFEQRSFKYVAINAGFWTVCMALMGGVLCAFC